MSNVLGTTFTLRDIRDGRATVRVGDREVSGAEGETVAAGPLTLHLTAVTEDRVTFTASLD